MVHPREADAALPGAHAAMMRAEVTLNHALFERVVMGRFLHGIKIIQRSSYYVRGALAPSVAELFFLCGRAFRPGKPEHWNRALKPGHTRFIYCQLELPLFAPRRWSAPSNIATSIGSILNREPLPWKKP